MPTHANPTIAGLIRPKYDRPSFEAIRQTLDRSGTLRIPVLPSGLFAAATVTDFSKGTNYHSSWVRDTVHVAYAHAVNGQTVIAAGAAQALCRFFQTQRQRLLDVIDEPTLKSDAMRRPHVRFNGDTLTELNQTWAHAQNDALGYFLWLVATLSRAGLFQPADDELDLLQLFPRYLNAIEYWSDEDSGHWEEAKKIEASSIGAVVAALRAYQAVWPADLVKDLLAKGEAALRAILPAECVQPDPAKRRDYDAALLFLIYPLRVVDSATADAIIERTVANLMGEIGIKRYLGDSFYCTNYETSLARLGDDPTRDFSTDLSARNALAIPGSEGQWCLFDSTLSTIYAERYRTSGRADDREKQTAFLNRALLQITRDDPPRCAAMQCPELYYIENGRMQTSKAVPLLWSQANLWTAMELMSQALREGGPRDSNIFRAPPS
ncbi:MAG: glycoside hydrolase family 15 protein [Planctomycetaceae bacterium]